MKTAIQKDPETFRPMTVTIRIETKDELDKLIKLLGDGSYLYTELYKPLVEARDGKF